MCVFDDNDDDMIGGAAHCTVSEFSASITEAAVYKASSASSKEVEQHTQCCPLLFVGGGPARCPALGPGGHSASKPP